MNTLLNSLYKSLEADHIEVVEKDVKRSLRFLEAEKGSPVSWSESSSDFRGTLTESKNVGTEDGPVLGLYITEIMCTKAGESNWKKWESTSTVEYKGPTLSFDQSVLKVIVPTDSTRKIEVEGSPYGPTSVEIG